jgi:glycosyltransferase involved in cell wall biosynthesis
MNTRMPLVSVVVPMRNAEKYVSAALESVLREKAVALEVVVVDDGSTDSSADRVAALQDPRVRVIPGPRKGFAACMNSGLSAARGELLMECDADDLYPPGRISAQARWLQRHPQFDAVCGSFSTIDAASRPVADLLATIGTSQAEITAELLQGVTRTHFCTYALRAAVVRAVGGFRDYFETGCDVDYQLRLGERARVMYRPENAYLYRLHDASLTHTQGLARRTFFETTARAFQNERRLGGSDALARGTPPEPPGDGTRRDPARAHIQGMLLGRAWREHGRGRKGQALRTGLRAALASPGRMEAWKSLLALGIKRSRP